MPARMREMKRINELKSSEYLRTRHWPALCTSPVEQTRAAVSECPQAALLQGAALDVQCTLRTRLYVGIRPYEQFAKGTRAAAPDDGIVRMARSRTGSAGRAWRGLWLAGSSRVRALRGVLVPADSPIGLPFPTHGIAPATVTVAEAGANDVVAKFSEVSELRARVDGEGTVRSAAVVGGILASVPVVCGNAGPVCSIDVTDGTRVNHECGWAEFTGLPRGFLPVFVNWSRVRGHAVPCVAS